MPRSGIDVGMQRPVQPGMIIAVGIAAVALVWLMVDRGTATRSERARNDAARLERSPVGPPHGVVLPPREQLPEAAEADPAPGAESGVDLDGNAMNGTWDAVDLQAVRAALPDNLYWDQAQPTDDPRVLEERDAVRARWNVEYGKVLSGTASEEEIRAYYDYRARLSSDYIEFATYLLDHYQETLPERDVGLLTLARRLHQARMEEIPRKIEEAFERKRAQDAARAAWLADQAAFDAAEPEGDTE